MQNPIDHDRLKQLSMLVRHWILTSTNEAGSGHPTSSMSAVELLADLFFGGFYRFDVGNYDNPNNDRLIFSKGHASPLLYSLWAAAGEVTEFQLSNYREFESPLEGHPTSRFKLAEVATGSLGQGLSIGVGMALNAKKLDQLPYRTFVLLGDSEMAEGAQWEAVQLAAHYQLNNLVGILDVNRLGQRGETMYGHDLDAYRKRLEAFDWRTIVVEDGHDHAEILNAYEQACNEQNRPVMIIARTLKGKGVSFLEDESGWHGKPLDDEKLQQALSELGTVDPRLRGELAKPETSQPATMKRGHAGELDYEPGQQVATRDAFGHALARLGEAFPDVVSIDGEVSNSTRAKFFKQKFPDRFFEMFIAEQNMAGVGLGLGLCEKRPFVSSFAAFLTRAFDQIRMSRHSSANIKFVGSHAGVSIGQDGPSQMGLEDIAMFRTILDSVVLYPCDAVSTDKLVAAMIEHCGISYLRTTRGDTPVIYQNSDEFHIGGSRVLRSSEQDVATIVTAGITVHEAIKACETLEQAGQQVRLIDLYSIKPLDLETLQTAARETEFLLTVEDHYQAGGIGEAVRSALAGSSPRIESLFVHKLPRSGQPEELLNDQGISAAHIVDAVKNRQPVIA
ncbi:MAG: transketolase [Planctomyces sp.]|nr:transketolase [Planctomyces sp.]